MYNYPPFPTLRAFAPVALEAHPLQRLSHLPSHQRHQPTSPLRSTHLPLFRQCQVPYHRHLWCQRQRQRQRHVSGRVTVAVLHAVLSTTALARMYVLMTSVQLALVARGVEGPGSVFMI